MKNLKLFSILFILVFACTEQNDVHRSIADQRRTAEFNSEQIGQMFYDRINTNALEDPLKGLSEQERQAFTERFDKLKAKGTVSAKDVLDEQLSEGHITPAIHRTILQYNEDLYQFVQETSDVDVALRWCLDRENAIKKQNDLTEFERERILKHQALLRNYIQATLENLIETKENNGARVESWKSIKCWVGCAIDNITSFSSVGTLVGPIGEAIGAGVGLIYTIVGGSGACPNCDTPPPCQAATAISSPDICYPPGGTKSFTAWGYGTAPTNFYWDFYNPDIPIPTTPFFTASTPTDQFTITAAQLGGRTRFAIILRSNCSGSLQSSVPHYFSTTDSGRPRPVVMVTEMGGNQVRYIVTGTNNGNPTWSFIPPYRGTLVGGNYNSTTIFIQWVSPQMRIGANVTTTSPCGTATANAY